MRGQRQCTQLAFPWLFPVSWIYTQWADTTPAWGRRPLWQDCKAGCLLDNKTKEYTVHAKVLWTIRPLVAGITAPSFFALIDKCFGRLSVHMLIYISTDFCKDWLSGRVSYLCSNIAQNLCAFCEKCHWENSHDAVNFHHRGLRILPYALEMCILLV